MAVIIIFLSDFSLSESAWQLLGFSNKHLIISRLFLKPLDSQ